CSVALSRLAAYPELATHQTSTASKRDTLQVHEALHAVRRRVWETNRSQRLARDFVRTGGPEFESLGAPDERLRTVLKSLSLRRIVAHMVVGGLAGIALALSAVAWFAMRLTLRAHTRSAGEWARLAALCCLGVAAIGAFAGDLLLDGIVVALLVPTAACVLGFAVAV